MNKIKSMLILSGSGVFQNDSRSSWVSSSALLENNSDNQRSYSCGS